jgi:thioredoxin reductase
VTSASRVGVAVIGGGPAGLAAAIAASEDGSSVLLVEREKRLGGILKQCIHDGFGILRYEERLTGPEYAFRDIVVLNQTNTHVMLQTFVSNIVSNGSTFHLTLCNRHGIVQVEAKTVVFATGCRERTSKQVAVHGTRPAGVLTAGTAQYFTNILGQLPTKNCVILGSGDIGLIMARRLTLEGANVIGVYEAAQTPGGLLRNVTQCLNDFDIPLHLGHTVTRTFGSRRLRAIEVCRVDKNLKPIRGTENVIRCDGLILSVGLIPENELAESLGVPICEKTHGPICDQNYMTMLDGVFSCGNAMSVSDLVDHVSESGTIAGQSASRYMGHERSLIEINASKDFLSVVPHYIDFEILRGETVIFFRTKEKRENTTVRIYVDNTQVYAEEYTALRPPEMQRISIDFSSVLTPESKISIRME